MIVRTLQQIIDSKRNVKGRTFVSRRFLLKEDGMGFTFTETIIHPGSEATICYRHYLEACYCLEGEGEIELVGPEAKVYLITPGTLYALDKHDKHILRAKTPLKLICVFVPALKGDEVHDEHGGYPPPE